MGNAAIYVRVSTAGQVEDGLGQEAQLEECYRIAERFELEVDPDLIFIEQASGEFLGRDKLDLLRSHVVDPELEAVICYDVDRLSREEADTMVLFKEAKENGVKIYTRHGVNGDSRIDNLLTYIRAYSAADEKDKIRRRTMDGKVQAVKVANVLPCGTGIGLFGYDYVPRSGEKRQYRLINEAEAIVVRGIFDKARGGWQVNTITRDLNDRGILSKTGKQWHRKNVLDLLKNPAYIGTTLYGRTKTTLKAHGKRDLTYRSPEDILEVESFTPPIIDAKTFQIVQKHLNRPRRSGHADEVYMLGGMVRCGNCGSNMTGHKLAGNVKYRYYTCNKCDARGARVDRVDQRIWDAVLKIIRDPQLLLTAIDQIKVQEPSKCPPPISDTVVSDLERARKREEHLFALVKESPTPSDAKVHMENLEGVSKEIRNLEALIDSQTPRAQSDVQLSTIKNYLSTLTGVDTDCMETRKAFLRRLGLEAAISDQGVTISATVEMPELSTIEQTSVAKPLGAYPKYPLLVDSLGNSHFK